MPLVFKRKPGESVMVGDDVQVRVVELHSGHVILAFEAPVSVPIHRLEVWRRLLEERHGARATEGGSAA